MIDQYIYPEFEVVRNEHRCIACRVCERQCANEVHRFDTDLGVMLSDETKCVGCLTCVLVCPYGAVRPGKDGAASKCELCLENSCGEPACVKGCPNNAIVYEERQEVK